MKPVCQPTPITLTVSQALALLDGIESLLERGVTSSARKQLEAARDKLNLSVHGIKTKPKPSKERDAYLAEYYGIWEDYYMGSCPTGDARDRALASLSKQYPNQEEPK